MIDEKLVLEEEISSKILSLLETTPNHTSHGETFPEDIDFFDVWSSFPNL